MLCVILHFLVLLYFYEVDHPMSHDHVCRHWKKLPPFESPANANSYNNQTWVESFCQYWGVCST